MPEEKPPREPPLFDDVKKTKTGNLRNSVEKVDALTPEEEADLERGGAFALREGRGVGSGGVYFEPALSKEWHERHAEAISSVAEIEDHPTGRTVKAHTAPARGEER